MIEIIQMDLGSTLASLGIDFHPMHPMLIAVDGEHGLLALDPNEGVARAFREVSPEEALARDAMILGDEPFEPESAGSAAAGLAAADFVIDLPAAPESAVALWHVFEMAESRWTIDFPGDRANPSGKDGALMRSALR